jgi:hypothetical protein
MRRAVSLLFLAACTASARAAGERVDLARQNVRDVLGRPEFRPLADADRLPDLPDLEGTWLDALIRVLNDIFGGLLESVAQGLGRIVQKVVRAIVSLFQGMTGGGAADTATAFGTVMTWTVVLAAVALLVWLLLRLARSAGTERRAGALALSLTEPGPADDDALARTPEDWRRRAERLAARGDRVEALRALYLELLAGLHRVGAIDYDRTRTNTAYVFDLARAHPARGPFLSLTWRFDRAVYGAHEPTESDLRTAMDEVDRVRGAFLRETAHA